MKNLFYRIIQHELKGCWRQPNDYLYPLLFFIMVVSLFPLGINFSNMLLKQMSAGIVWIAVLLATLLGFERLFRTDFDNGYLEQMILSPHPLALIVLAKVTAHWLLTSLPLLIISPVLALMLHLSVHVTVALFLSLLLGTPILNLLGSIISALTVALPNGSILLPLLLLPLYVPILIFGAGTISSALIGAPINGSLALLGAYLIIAVMISPFVTAAALRIGISL